VQVELGDHFHLRRNMFMRILIMTVIKVRPVTVDGLASVHVRGASNDFA
jgi:hypothetical protein